MQGIECDIRERAHDVDKKGNLRLGHLGSLEQDRCKSTQCGGPGLLTNESRDRCEIGGRSWLAEPR
jgi:hypothetical protein